MPQARPGDHRLEDVRAELRRMGYLSHRVERYLLQDALRPHRPVATVLGLAGKLALLGGAMLALGGSLLLASWNPWVYREPFELLPLFLHLLPLGAVIFGGAFLTLAAVLAGALVAYPAFRLDTVSFVVATAGGALLLAPALIAGWRLAGPAGPWELALVAAGAAAGVYVAARLFYHGLLALAIRLTDRTPRRRLLARRWLLLAAVVFVALLALLPAVRAAAAAPPRAPASFPTAAGGRALLIGVDGVLPEELDYLLRRGRLPHLAALAADGLAAAYRRPVREEPAVFWTTVATGVGSDRHGVAAVDGFRPLGISGALAVNGFFRFYWQEVGVPLGLAEQRPLLANRRRAASVWELAARGGRPVVAVGWWGTFPAEPLPGLVVAHGAYQLIGEAGALAPEAASTWIAPLRHAAPPASVEVLRAALAPAEAAALAARSVVPDAFYRAVFARALAELRPRAATLYLPAIDLAADGWPAGAVAFADLVASELAALDELLGEVLADGSWRTVAVVVDPGRRGGGSGRLLLRHDGGCTAGAASEVAPEQVAASLVRALGLPQSRELPAPVAGCSWPDPPVVLPTFGDRSAPAPDVGSEGYLENLRSLGYL